MDNLTHVVYIAGHGGFDSRYPPDAIPSKPFDAVNSSFWALPSYRHGETPLYGEHVHTAIRIAEKTPNSLLIFSAGFNSPDYIGNVYNWSEANSYLVGAEKSGWISSLSENTVTSTDNSFAVPVHILRTESGNELTAARSEYARDSLEEVLGGLVLFDTLSGGNKMKSLTVVGWQFKEKRFYSHATALNVPENIFSYVGVNNPSQESIENAISGEEATLAAFLEDPLGNSHPNLVRKRKQRDPLARGNPHWKWLDR